MAGEQRLAIDILPADTMGPTNSGPHQSVCSDANMIGSMKINSALRKWRHQQVQLGQTKRNFGCFR